MIKSIIKLLPLHWQLVPFASILENGTRNGIYKSKEFHGKGVKIVNMGELFAYPRLFSVEMKRVQLSEREKELFLLKSGDLLFARRSLVAEGAGRCSVVCEIVEPTTFESSIIRARPNKQIADGLFLFYLFNSQLGKYLIGTLIREMAVSGITGKDLSNLHVPLPPIKEQKKIAKVLSSLDDKIELNRRMNETFEAIAQTLFKAWFVDFEPVRANVENRPSESASPEIAKLFPSEFENGTPKGWERKPLIDFFRLIGGGTPKTTTPEFWNGDVLWYSVVDAPSESDIFVIDTEKKITQLGLEKSSTKLLRKGVTIISARGTVGKLAIAGSEMTMNQSCYAIEGKFGDYFNYYVVNAAIAELKQKTHGAVFDTITQDTFKSIHQILPKQEVITAFENSISSTMQKIEQNLRQNKNLSEIRDSLLPRLISGKIPVSKVESEAEGENE
jgi:type I restriction enzyme S subunit